MHIERTFVGFIERKSLFLSISSHLAAMLNLLNLFFGGGMVKHSLFYSVEWIVEAIIEGTPLY